ncbi:MAG TPA: MFS transporter, partial [Chloroflexota bacterium]|nr:MFS transporter [Chloroflexota bacterium]
MSLPVVSQSEAVPVASPWQRWAHWGAAGALLVRPFAGIPLALRDDVYRPLFIFFLLIGSGAGLWLNFTAVWLAQGLGATPAQVGWFFSASFLAAALGNVTLPALAERVGSRKTVALWALISGIPCLPVLAYANGYWMALLAILPLWLGAGLFGLLLGVVGDVARGRARDGGSDLSGTVIGALQTAFALGNTLGPLFGGWLYEQTGQLRPGILLHLIPATAAIWVLWRFVPDERAKTIGGAPARRQAGAVGWGLLALLAAQVWFRLGDSRGPFESIYAAQDLGASKAQVGLLITLLAAFQLVLTPVAGALADRIGAGVVTAMGIGILAAHGFLLSGTTVYWQQLVLVSLTAAGLAIGTTAPFVYAQQLAPGRASLATGWINACFFLGLAAGSPLAGRVVELAGFRGLFVFSGGMDLVAASLV